MPRSGGQARRLTSTPSAEIDPWFSPDGSRLAFTATVGGNTDVYVVPVTGGEPTRLTFHPGLDAARGWSPDGSRVLFASTRETVPVPGLPSIFRLWSVAVGATGAVTAVPEVLPMPRAFTGSLFTGRPPHRLRRGRAWVRVRLGAEPEQPVAELSRRAHASDPADQPRRQRRREAAVDQQQRQRADVGRRHGLLPVRSQRHDQPVQLPAGAKEVTALTRHDDFDIMNASATSDAIVYEQGGDLHLLDLASKQARQLTIEVTGDFPWARPQLKKVASMMRSAVLSPTGVRAAFEARGEIFTVPAEKGQPRNLTQSSGTHDRSPVWSPDGRDIAWLSDASGEYQLMIAEQTGVTKPRTIALPSKAFFSAPVWSPDGKQLLLEDNHLALVGDRRRQRRRR